MLLLISSIGSIQSHLLILSNSPFYSTYPSVHAFGVQGVFVVRDLKAVYCQDEPREIYAVDRDLKHLRCLWLEFSEFKIDIARHSAPGLSG